MWFGSGLWVSGARGLCPTEGLGVRCLREGLAAWVVGLFVGGRGVVGEFVGGVCLGLQFAGMLWGATVGHVSLAVVVGGCVLVCVRL